MSAHCPNPVNGFSFPPEKITAAIARRGLLSMEIEFSRTCNFRCPYCYNTELADGGYLTGGEIDSVLQQAGKLGAEKIIVLGGEPMIYPLIREKIELIRSLGMAVEMFTNGSCMTEGNAQFMYDHEVSVVLKMNSFKAELQNQMTGRADAQDIIWSAYRQLLAAGYPAPGKRFAVSTVISRHNLAEIPGLWRWLRERGIEPYFEMITPQGGALDDEDMVISAARHRELFEQLAAIDRNEFGLDWQPQPPLVGNSCLRHRYSCLVNAYGDVMPCVGVTIPLGNVRRQSLRQILEQSEVLEHLRELSGRIKEPCASCSQSEFCYGCRGAAYQLTGDYLAADPMCWHNQNAVIERMPVSAAAYLPHQPPIRMVEKILEIGERSAKLLLRVPGQDASWLVDDNGALEAAASIELVAQALAAVSGFQAAAREGAADHRGYLLGAKGFRWIKTIFAGDLLEISLRKLARFGEFGIVEGVITRDGEELTRGEVNVYQARADS